MKHHWARRVIDGFENNPRVQARFHIIMMIVWIALGLVGPALMLLASGLWLKIGVLFVYELSVYANWDTDYGALSASQASMKAGEK